MGLVTGKYLKVTIIAEDEKEAFEIITKTAKYIKIRGFVLQPFKLSPGESGTGSYTYYSQVVKKVGTRIASRARGDFR